MNNDPSNLSHIPKTNNTHNIVKLLKYIYKFFKVKMNYRNQFFCWSEYICMIISNQGRFKSAHSSSKDTFAAIFDFTVELGDDIFNDVIHEGVIRDGLVVLFTQTLLPDRIITRRRERV